MGRWNIGDIVRLRSGGPIMIVNCTHVADNCDDVECVWFDGAELKSGEFAPATLDPVTIDPAVTP